MAYYCPSCKGKYTDILEHIRKKHPTDAYTALQLQPLGLTPCPICATACKGTHGAKTHSAKVHGVVGNSKTSTLPRIHTQPPRASTFDPEIDSTTPTLPRIHTQPPRASTFDPEIDSTNTPYPILLSRANKRRPQTSQSPITPLPQRTLLKGKRQAKTPSPGVERAATRLRRAPTSQEKPIHIDSASEDDLYDASTIGHSPTPSFEDAQENNPQEELPRHETRAVPSLPIDSLDTPTRPINSTTRPQRPIPSLRLGSIDSQPVYSQRPQATTAAIDPKEARDHQKAIATSLEKQAVQTLLAYSKVYIPEKRLHARQAALFTEAANRAALAFLRQPREKQLLDFLLLPRVLGIGLQKEELAKTLRAYPTTIPELPDTPQEEPRAANNESPAKRAIKLLQKGFIGRASSALTDPTPLAPDTPETLNALYSKHPIGHQNPFGNANPTPGQNITQETVQQAIKSIGQEKAPGLSGWTRPLLDIALTTAKSPVLLALTQLANMIRQGTAPGADLLCASRLIGLQKPDGGVRPIAVGDLIYKVALKALLITSFSKDMLLPNQLGVNSVGGVEPAIFLLEEAISGPNRLETKQIASLDLVNAYNRIGRTTIAAAVAKYAPTFYRAAKWAYNYPSILVTNSGQTLASAEGVRQGDPLAPLLFSLAIRPMLEHLQKTLPKASIIAYLDDMYILNPETTPLLPRVIRAFKESPVALNKEKSSEQSVDRLRITGLKALGTFIGPEAERRTFLQGKIDILSKAIKTIQNLPKQYALLLLRGSIQLLLRHLQRQLYSEDLLDLWERADQEIKDAVQALIAREPGNTSPLIRQGLLSLPIRQGGLGIPQHALLAPGLLKAAREASRPILSQICPDIYRNSATRTPTTAKEVYTKINQELEDKLDSTLAKSALKAKLENASYLGRQWLRVLPTQKHYILADSAVTEALRTRLLLPVKTPLVPCNACGTYPIIGHEDVCRGAERRWIIRHDEVTRAFIRTLSSREDLKVEAEPRPANTSGTPVNSRRPDFSVLLGTSRHYYDVQIVAINKDSAKENPFDTLTEAAKEKQRKYSDLGELFHPIIISAGGLMEEETAKTYKALQKLVGHSRAKWLDNSIALTLTQARGIAATSIIAKN